nr:TPA_asm: hypothetical protein [False wolf spider monodnaparvovirus]
MAYNAPAPVEHSTLIYTLLPDAPITFKEFFLIIRSLHGFKLDFIKEEEACKTVTVGLHFFANVGNARKKLGGAAEFIEVSRISDNVEKCELQDLAKLRSIYKFGSNVDDEEPGPSSKNKKRKYKNGN